MKWLVAVDIDDGAEALLTQAVSLGAHLGASLHVRAVVPPPVARTVAHGADLQAADHHEALRRHAGLRLAELAEAIPEPMRGSVAVRVGQPAATLIEQAGAYDAVVLGTHARRGLSRLFLGSVAERVVRLAASDVIVVRLDGRAVDLDRGVRVVAAMDAHDPSPVVGARLKAMPADTELHVVDVLPSQAAMVTAGLLSAPADTPAAHPHHGWCERHLVAFLDEQGIAVTPDFVLMTHGSAGDELAAVAQAIAADIVLIDHHRRQGLERLAFGSTAERLVRVAPCAVWVAHPGAPS